MSVMNTKIVQIKSEMRLLYKTLKTVYCNDKHNTIIISSIYVIMGLIPVAQMGILTHFIDEVMILYQLESVWRLWSSVVALLLIVSVSILLDPIGQMILEKMKLNLKQSIDKVLVSKVASIKYHKLDNSEFKDISRRVLEKPGEQLVVNYNDIFKMISLVISVVSTLTVIFMKNWWIATFILIIIYPMVKVSILAGKADYQVEKYITTTKRRYEYLSELLCSKENYEERILYGYADTHQVKYKVGYDSILNERLRINAIWFFKGRISGIVVSVYIALVLVLLLQPLVTHTITLGFYISMLSLLISISRKLSWGVNDGLRILIISNRFMSELQSILDSEVILGALEDPIHENQVKSIRFENVSFTYPDSENLILDEVSFELIHKKRYVFIGPNGAGKSTIIKLLTGMYDNYTGNIYINGKELRTYTYQVLKGFFTVLYQDFIKHELSIDEFVNLGKQNDIYANKQSRNQILECFEVGKMIEGSPNGFSSNLGKSYLNGTELSGGEWQKLALARTFNSDAPVIILDEPTSAMDSNSENRFFEKIDTLCNSRLMIIISHKMSFAGLSDEIIVFEHGKIVEQGSCACLIRKQGVFSKMHTEQRIWYTDEELFV